MSLRRFLLNVSLVTAVFGWVSTLHAEETRPAGKAYTIKMERPSKVGEKADISITATSKETQTITYKDREPDRSIDESKIVVEGRSETIEVNTKGYETKVSLKITRAEVTKAGKTTEILPKGTILQILLDKEKTVFQLDGKPVSDEVEESLSVALSLHDPRLHSDDELYANDKQQKVGDSWPLNPQLMAEDLTVDGLAVDQKNVSGKTTLVGVTDSNGVPCLHLQLSMEAENIKVELGEGITPTKATVQMLLHTLMPIDESSQYGIVSLATRMSITARREASKGVTAATLYRVVERGRAMSATPVQ